MSFSYSFTAPYNKGFGNGTWALTSYAVQFDPQASLNADGGTCAALTLSLAGDLVVGVAAGLTKVRCFG